MHAWNFTLFGGTTGFRPTAAVHAMFDNMVQHCALSCDDQTEIYARLLDYRVEWVDPGKTNTEHSFPLEFFKFGYTRKKVFLRTAIFEHSDVMRGRAGESAMNPDLCEKMWFMMPLVPQSNWKKLDMIIKFLGCYGWKTKYCNPHHKLSGCYNEVITVVVR